MEGGGKVEKEKKVPKKIQETRQSSHTHTHAKRHKSPPKNPTVTLRIHTHTHTQPSGMSRGHTRPKIQRDKEMDVSF